MFHIVKGDSDGIRKGNGINEAILVYQLVKKRQIFSFLYEIYIHKGTVCFQKGSHLLMYPYVEPMGVPRGVTLPWSIQVRCKDK